MNVKNIAKGAADAVNKNFGKAKNAVGGAINKAKDAVDNAVSNAVDKATGPGRQLGSNVAIGRGLVDKIPNQHVRGASSLAINAGIGAVGGGLVGMVAGEADDDSSKMKGFVAGAAIGAGVMTAGTLYMNKHDLQIAKGLTKDAMDGTKGVGAKAAEVVEEVAGTNEAERMAAARAAFNERTGKNATKNPNDLRNMHIDTDGQYTFDTLLDSKDPRSKDLRNTYEDSNGQLTFSAFDNTPVNLEETATTVPSNINIEGQMTIDDFIGDQMKIDDFLNSQSSQNINDSSTTMKQKTTNKDTMKAINRGVDRKLEEIERMGKKQNKNYYANQYGNKKRNRRERRK